jgi:hypothetical protein
MQNKLIEQVLHPFYVFQIASIALWSIDDYYYYAFAIAVISISSILGTLIETKRTIERMREMSRFHCDVNVLVDGDCKYRPLGNTQSIKCNGLTRQGKGVIAKDWYLATSLMPPMPRSPWSRATRYCYAVTPS